MAAEELETNKKRMFFPFLYGYLFPVTCLEQSPALLTGAAGITCEQRGWHCKDVIVCRVMRCSPVSPCRGPGLQPEVRLCMEANVVHQSSVGDGMNDSVAQSCSAGCTARSRTAPPLWDSSQMGQEWPSCRLLPDLAEIS